MFDNVTFWLFLAAATVASLTFVTIVVWAESRRKERQEYYRFEFRKRLIESGKMDAASFASLMRYEHDLGLLQSRQKLMVAAFVFVGTGVGTCLGLQFIGGLLWMVGLIPVSIGLSLFAYGVFFAAKPDLGAPPPGVNPAPDERD